MIKKTYEKIPIKTIDRIKEILDENEFEEFKNP